MEGSKAILQALQDFKKQFNKVSETKSLNDKSIEVDYGVDVVLPKDRDLSRSKHGCEANFWSSRCQTTAGRA